MFHYIYYNVYIVYILILLEIIVLFNYYIFSYIYFIYLVYTINITIRDTSLILYILLHTKIQIKLGTFISELFYIQF